MRALTADVLRKETIENHQTVIKDVQESQATVKGDGSDTDNIQDSDYEADLERIDQKKVTMRKTKSTTFWLILTS